MKLQRVYFYHVRRTGGQSVNYAFLTTLCGDGDAAKKRLLRDRYISCNGKGIVGWDVERIRQGDFFYAFSHVPEHILCLPGCAFTFTCLREPSERLLSYYRMLLDLGERGERPDITRNEGQYLGNSFEDFLRDVPKMHLLNQVWMFSVNFDPMEAFDRIVALDYRFFLEDFEKGLWDLEHKLGLNLKPVRLGASPKNFEPNAHQLEMLREALELEYRLYERLREFESLYGR